MRDFEKEPCRNCGGVEWVCENHEDLPWEGMSSDPDACHCGAGSPCPVCNKDMACAGRVHIATDPLKARLKAIKDAELAYRKVMDGRTGGIVLAKYAALQKLILSEPTQ